MLDIQKSYTSNIIFEYNTAIDYTKLHRNFIVLLFARGVLARVIYTDVYVRHVHRLHIVT